jgi:hypothetical protein
MEKIINKIKTIEETNKLIEVKKQMVENIIIEKTNYHLSKLNEVIEEFKPIYPILYDVIDDKKDFIRYHRIYLDKNIYLRINLIEYNHLQSWDCYLEQQLTGYTAYYNLKPITDFERKATIYHIVDSCRISTVHVSKEIMEFLITISPEILKEKIKTTILRELQNLQNIKNKQLIEINKQLEIFEQIKLPTKSIKINSCYITTITEALETIKDKNIAALLFDGMVEQDILNSDIDEILKNFCYPLAELDEDITIELK